jgi:hypothetical protein
MTKDRVAVGKIESWIRLLPPVSLAQIDAGDTAEPPLLAQDGGLNPAATLDFTCSKSIQQDKVLPGPFVTIHQCIPLIHFYFSSS